MSFLQRSPYLREQREFPSDDLKMLARQSDQAYIDIAQKVNSRVIGSYALDTEIVTGEKWFVSGSAPKQTLRKLFKISSTGSIPHGLNLSQTSGITKIYGTFTDGSVWYPIPYVDATSTNNQIQVTIDTTNIILTAGGGSPPTISSGWITIEYLSQV